MSSQIQDELSPVFAMPVIADLCHGVFTKLRLQPNSNNDYIQELTGHDGWDARHHCVHKGNPHVQ